MEQGDSNVLLKAAGLSKAYPPAVQALTDAGLELRHGEVHALVGENGAGKSTLSRVLAGITQPDAGRMLLNGQPYHPTDRHDAERHGVRSVMQELNLIPTLTVAENIFIDRLPHRFGWVNYRHLEAEAARLLALVGLQQVDPGAPVGSLGIGQQQLVEIAAGLSAHCEVLILDEPTAALTDPEVDLLFRQIEDVKRRGAAIVYISHRMGEIARIADRVTILRDGGVVAAGEPAANMPAEKMIRLMVGRELEAARERQDRATEVVLRVENLRAGPAVRDISFELHRGEILGFAGLMGSGRTETMRALFGADTREAGAIYLRGQSAPTDLRSSADAVRAGVAFLTEDRKGEGLLLPLSVRHNVSLARLGDISGAVGWIPRERERMDSEDLVQRLRIRCSSVDQPVQELSGGNQQKVVLAKWLYRDSDIFIFDEPTRGIDVGAKFEIYQLLAELTERGKAVAVVSSDLPELLAICDRIAVLSAGSLVRIFSRAEFDQDAIMRAALKHY